MSISSMQQSPVSLPLIHSSTPTDDPEPSTLNPSSHPVSFVTTSSPSPSDPPDPSSFSVDSTRVNSSGN